MSLLAQRGLVQEPRVIVEIVVFIVIAIVTAIITEK